MDPTPASLLDQLRQPAPGPAWDRFVLLYTPLLYLWANRLGVTGPDADDVVQDVFTVLVEILPEFRYNPDQRFRGWLWTVTRNKVRERGRRAPAPVAAGDFGVLAESAQADPVEEIDAQEYRHYLTRRAMDLMQADFEPVTWRAFWETVAAGRSVADVAAELGLTSNAVYLAKARVLRRLRDELAGLLD